MLVLTGFFAFLFIAVLWYRSKPHIQRRSPILILVITFGAWLDSMLELGIHAIQPKDFGLQCQLAIVARLVAHYICYIYILVRIYIVHQVNKLHEEMWDSVQKAQEKD